MSDARTVLAEWQQHTDAATEGPWAVDDGWQAPGWPLGMAYTRVANGEPNPISGIRTPLVSTNGAMDGSPPRRQNVQDAEFIATAREAMPKLLAAVEAVLALHTTTMRKVRVYEPGRVSFGDLVERPFCSHCKHAGDAPHPWPCPTVQAINDALLASEPSGSEQ